MSFNTILDKIEYELNQGDINLTDGFYSEDDEENDDDKKGSDGKAPDDSSSIFKSE